MGIVQGFFDIKDPGALRGHKKSVEEAVSRIDTYFMPLLKQKNKNELDGRFRILEKIHHRYAVKDYKHWNSTNERIAKQTSGLLVEVYKKTQTQQSIILQVAVRIGRKDVRDYPRFHMPNDIHTLKDLYSLLSVFGIHFCILTIDPFVDKPAYFSINRFDYFKEEDYQLNARKKQGKPDRMVLRSSVREGRELHPLGKEAVNFFDRLEYCIEEQSKRTNHTNGVKRESKKG